VVLNTDKDVGFKLGGGGGGRTKTKKMKKKILCKYPTPAPIVL
jgi:hypothetical protein